MRKALLVEHKELPELIDQLTILRDHHPVIIKPYRILSDGRRLASVEYHSDDIASSIAKEFAFYETDLPVRNLAEVTVAEKTGHTLPPGVVNGKLTGLAVRRSEKFAHVFEVVEYENNEATLKSVRMLNKDAPIDPLKAFGLALERFHESAHGKLGDEAHRFEFPNGYGASVVRSRHSYGGRDGLWEIAVLDERGRVTYATPVTSDVKGNLTTLEAREVLEEIQALPRKENA